MTNDSPNDVSLAETPLEEPAMAVEEAPAVPAHMVLRLSLIHISEPTRPY